MKLLREDLKENRAMEYTGQIRGNVIVLDAAPDLPEGTRVKVVPIPDKAASPLGEMLLSFAGCVRGLPDDMAENHDHYLYGTPKR